MMYLQSSFITRPMYIFSQGKEYSLTYISQYKKVEWQQQAESIIIQNLLVELDGPGWTTNGN